MWPFKKKPKSPIDDAIGHIYRATEIAYQYKRDQKHVPTEEEINQLWQLHHIIWQYQCTLEYIARNMQARKNGEPEGAAKWHNKEVFDWHYPDS